MAANYWGTGAKRAGEFLKRYWKVLSVAGGLQRRDSYFFMVQSLGY